MIVIVFSGGVNVSVAFNSELPFASVVGVSVTVPGSVPNMASVKVTLPVGARFLTEVSTNAVRVTLAPACGAEELALRLKLV